MTLKQISLTIPEKLLNETKNYSKEYGYRNVQELILELVRNRVLYEKMERYQQIEKDMKIGKKMKKFSQKEAIDYLKSL